MHGGGLPLATAEGAAETVVGSDEKGEEGWTRLQGIARRRIYGVSAAMASRLRTIYSSTFFHVCTDRIKVRVPRLETTIVSGVFFKISHFAEAAFDLDVIQNSNH